MNGAWRHRYRKDDDDPNQPYRGRIGEVCERDMEFLLYSINEWVTIQGSPVLYRVVAIEPLPERCFAYRLEREGLTGTSGPYPERMLRRVRRA